VSDLAARLRDSFRWTGTDRSDPSSWWRDGEVLAEIGPALADLHREAHPTVVLGIEARGFLLGPLVATALGIGFVEVRKDLHPDDAGERLLRRTTPPDYEKRSLTLTIRPGLLRPKDRALLVDDWIETGAQATAVQDLVSDAEARWVGVAVVIDALPSEARRQLEVRSLLRERTLPWYR
jgi:adenine phosphoribosyltransferase